MDLHLAAQDSEFKVLVKSGPVEQTVAQYEPCLLMITFKVIIKFLKIYNTFSIICFQNIIIIVTLYT